MNAQCELAALTSERNLRRRHRTLIEQELAHRELVRFGSWTESVAGEPRQLKARFRTSKNACKGMGDNRHNLFLFSFQNIEMMMLGPTPATHLCDANHRCFRAR
jgi:hypothetical protein